MALSDIRLKKITQGKGLYDGDQELTDGHGLSVRISVTRNLLQQCNSTDSEQEI